MDSEPHLGEGYANEVMSKSEMCPRAATMWMWQHSCTKVGSVSIAFREFLYFLHVIQDRHEVYMSSLNIKLNLPYNSPFPLSNQAQAPKTMSRNHCQIGYHFFKIGYKKYKFLTKLTVLYASSMKMNNYME